MGEFWGTPGMDYDDWMMSLRSARERREVRPGTWYQSPVMEGAVYAWKFERGEGEEVIQIC